MDRRTLDKAVAGPARSTNASNHQHRSSTLTHTIVDFISQFPLMAAIVALLVSLLLLAIGVLVGQRLAARRRIAPSASPDGAHSEALVQTLLQWTNSLVGDVDQCRAQMAAIQQGVLNSDSNIRHSPDLLVDMMSRMIEANAQMRQRLSFAEDALADQAKHIARTLNEARTDVLTGLPNRRMFDEELARRHAEFVRYGAAYSLLMLDIDHFKRFNDTYGHLAGDEVLKHIARIIGHTLRETDILARLGGEEFAVLLSSTSGRDSHTAAERARTAVESAVIEYEGQALQVTLSCGLAEPLEGESTDELIRRSDDALYASKHAGRNCGRFHDGWRCLRLGSRSDSPTAVAIAIAASPPKSETELAAACDALRQRLLEVTACK